MPPRHEGCRQTDILPGVEQRLPFLEELIAFVSALHRISVNIMFKMF